MAGLNTSRLRTQLLNTGLQQKDNPLFQVIDSLIDSLENTQNTVSSSSSGGGGGGSSTVINNYITQLETEVGINNGIDGMDSYISGPMGPPGRDGLTIFVGFEGNSFDDNLIPIDISTPRPLGYLRIITVADANNITPSSEISDIVFQNNTQAAGNLTMNSPTGTPFDGQLLEIILKSTNVQTFVWNAIFVGCTTTALPAASSGGNLTDKFFFQYNNAVNKWQIYNAQFGYV